MSFSRSIVTNIMFSQILIGCASVNSQLKFDYYGEYDKKGEAQVRQEFKTLQGANLETILERINDVVLLQDTLPEGIRSDSGTLSVAPGYKHIIVGKFVLVPDAVGTQSILKFADYKDNWRKPLCYPQVVLSYATLMIWPILPVAYPCFSKFGTSKEDYATEMKKIGLAAGGDLIIFSFLFDNADKESALSATGYVLKIDPKLKRKK